MYRRDMSVASLNDSMHLPFNALSSREGTGPDRTLIGSPCHSQMIPKLCGTGDRLTPSLANHSLKGQDNLKGV